MCPAYWNTCTGSSIVICIVTIVFFYYNLKIVRGGGDGAYPMQTRIGVAPDSACPDAFPP
jgi:hypothetical protein